MHTSRFLFAAGLAAILLGCQGSPRSVPDDELPRNNPTATSADLARDR